MGKKGRKRERERPTSIEGTKNITFRRESEEVRR
jgi:hypothetical protein